MSSIIKIGDIVETYLKDQKYHGIVIEISEGYCYVELFDTFLNNSSPLPFYYSSLTKISS